MTLDRSISIYERRRSRWPRRSHNSAQPNNPLRCVGSRLFRGFLLFSRLISMIRHLLHVLLYTRFLLPERDLIADDDVIMTNICSEHYSVVRLSRWGV